MPYLPLTPQPKAEESIFSWVIRVAEANIVPSPWHIFKLVGFTQGEMKTPRLDTSRLWHLISDSPTILDPLKYTNGLGYAFRGQPISVRDLSIRTPKLCPDCIADNNYASAHWDLELTTCCHIHGRRLVSKCPSCNKQISWFRPDLLHCSCGASFTEAPIQEASPAEVGLNELIYRVAFGKTPKANESNPAFSALAAVPLQYLLRIITVIGTLSIQELLVAGKRNRVSVTELLHSTARVLEGWPDSFHEFLLRLSTRKPRPRQERFGVLGNINDFSAALIERTEDRKHGELFRAEIRRFLANTWDGPIDSRIVLELIQEGLTPRWIPLHLASQQLKVNRRTLRLIMNRGLIRYKVESTSMSRHILLCSADVKPEWFAPTDLLNERRAAERIGMPVSVLRDLRRSGEYVQTYFGPNSVRFAQRDVDSLRLTVLSGRHYKPSDSDHGVPLDLVMRMKFRSSSAKADIVRALIRGEIRTVISESDSLNSLILHPGDLGAVLEKVMRPATGSMTDRQAGRAIRTTKEVVNHLSDSGYLTKSSDGLIHSQSVLDFIDNYSCLSSLLFYRKEKIAMAEAICAREDIDLIVAPSKSGTTRRFIRNADIWLIKESVMERPTSSSRWSAADGGRYA